MKLNKLAEDIAQFNKENGLNIDPKNRLLDLYSELGEVAKEILKGSDYGKEDLSLSNDFNEEIGDCFYSLISLANETDVHLEESLQKVKQKYAARKNRTGHIGSGA